MASWKRKTQKAQGEMNDTKLLLEEQTSRNTLLEKKQRKFDAELGSLQEERKADSMARDKLQRELEDLKRQRFAFEDEIQVRAANWGHNVSIYSKMIGSRFREWAVMKHKSSIY